MEINNALWQLILQTDSISKGILILLMFMSILCWTITLYKSLLIQAKKNQLSKTISLISNISDMEEFISKSSMLQRTFSGEIIAHFLTDFKTLVQSYKNKILINNIMEKDWQMLQASMNQTIEDIIAKEESLISILSTCAQVSPLIGLFGTVWGLIHAFLGISFNQAADIASVAPGIAEALITTLAGLIVAIPALIMYNFLQNRFKMLEYKLILFMERCYWIIRSFHNEQNSSNYADSYISDLTKLVEKEV